MSSHFGLAGLAGLRDSVC